MFVLSKVIDMVNCCEMTLIIYVITNIFRIPMVVSVNDEDEFGNKKSNASSTLLTKIKKTKISFIRNAQRKAICSVVNNLPLGCLQNNIVDLWKYNSTIVRGLTEEDILMWVNNVKLR